MSTDTEVGPYDKGYAELVLGAKCGDCPLRVGGRFVPSEGRKDAKLALVGEAPGIQEARDGRPFVGPSGRLLQLVLDRYGIKREDALLTNACLCRPADGTTPPKAAIQACRPRLLHELSSVGTARDVVAMGNSAALGLLGVEGVTKLRVGPGRKSPFPDLDGRRIIATVHPAACLRQSDMFPNLVTDIGKVVNQSVAWSEPDYVVFDDPVDAISELDRIAARAGDLVVDIEVDIDKESSFDHPNRYGQLCVGLGYEEGRAVVIGEGALANGEVLDHLRDALRASRIVAQNGKFDLAGLQPAVGSQTLYFDTMLASYCLDERPGIHGLKHMAVEYLGAPQYDEEIKRYVGPRDGYGVIPRDLLYKYNAYDVVSTYLLYKLFSQRLDEAGLRPLHDFLVEASNELVFLELNGLAVDRSYISQLTQDYTASLRVIEEEIDQVLIEGGAWPINPRSPKQIQEIFAHFRVRTASTNEETLQTLRERLEANGKEAHPFYRFIVLLLKHRKEAKLFGTYVKGTANRLYRGRVYPTFLLHGTTTGRLSCRNPNLQNVPRDSSIKRLFVPGHDGNVFVQADFGQAELRVLTKLAGESYFQDILNDDTHDLFDELTPILYPELPSKDAVPPELWKEIRIRVKAFVYGLGYGRTEYSIAKEYSLPVEEAKEVKDRFFHTIPAVVEWQSWVKNQVWTGKDLVTPFGRHRRFHLITEDNWKATKNEALAFLPQSTSSDICLRAMVRVRRDLRGSGAFIRNIVHDSILVDCPSDMATDVAELLDRRMVESGREFAGDYVKFKTDCKIGKNWGEV